MTPPSDSPPTAESSSTSGRTSASDSPPAIDSSRADSSSKSGAPSGGSGLAGGIAAHHKERARLPLYVAPTLDDDTNTVRLPLLPIACWRLEDLRFEFDSSFVRPEAREEFTALAQLRASHDGAPLSIFGHADPVGDDDYNKTLSGRRALAVYAVLIRDIDRWERLYSNKFGGDDWGVRAIQRMLVALGFDPGVVDGKMGGKTRESVRSFQRSKGLEPDGDPGKQTRKALFSDYMDAICQDDSGSPFTQTKDDFLARGSDPNLRGDVHGCSEFNLVLVLSKGEDQALSKDNKKAERDATNLPNRRVLVFLFPPGSQANLDKWPCPAAEKNAATCAESFWSNADARRAPSEARRNYASTHDTMACRFYDRMARGSPCEVARRALMLRLLNPDSEPIPRAAYRLTLADGRVREGEADENGWLVEQNVPTTDTCTLAWGYPTDFGITDEERAVRWLYAGPYGYQTEVSLNPDDADTEEDKAMNRLVTLGYSPSGTLDENITAFQRDYHVFPADGNLDARTKKALLEAFGEGLSKDEYIAKHAGDAASGS